MANEMITKRILVVTAESTRISYVQGTTMIPLQFILTDFDIPAGATANLIVRKPSGLVVYNTGVIDRTENSITVSPTAQTFAEAGLNQAQLQIAISGQILNSYLIQVKVEPCIVTDDMVESSNDFTGLAKVVQDVVSVAYAAVADYCEDNGIVTGASPEQAAQLEALAADMASLKEGISGGTFADWDETGEEEG